MPIRPWGVQAFASASGTASDDATVFVGLPPGRAYESPEMLVVVSPTLRRMLIELALGQDAYPLDAPRADLHLPVPPDTTADRAGDLLAATSALAYLRAVRRRRRARGGAADRADPRAGGRADRRCRTRTAAGPGSPAAARAGRGPATA